MDCTGNTISFKMQRAYPKHTGGVEVFSALKDKSFFFVAMLLLDGEVCIEIPNSLSETSAAVLHYTASVGAKTFPTGRSVISLSIVAWQKFCHAL